MFAYKKTCSSTKIQLAKALLHFARSSNCNLPHLGLISMLLRLAVGVMYSIFQPLLSHLERKAKCRCFLTGRRRVRQMLLIMIFPHHCAKYCLTAPQSASPLSVIQ